MISGNCGEMLKNLVAMADDRRPLVGEATFYMPSMCFSGLNVTG
jgi:predicted Zn-dependent protease